MDAPLLIALARAQLREHPGWGVEAPWCSERALGLRWGRGMGAECWILLLQPLPELWRLPADHAACRHLMAEGRVDAARAWGPWLVSARLKAVEGDPSERWLGLVFQRRAITGRLETVRLAFQAIPGRAGLRLDGVDVAASRLGLGVPFPAAAPPPGEDPPPLQRWKARFGDRWEEALDGGIPEALEGEGDLLSRHRAWSEARAEALILRPLRATAQRRLDRESARLERLEAGMAADRHRHQELAEARTRAVRLSAELYRLKGQEGQVELLEGGVLDLPQGLSAEEAAQAWFQQAKKAERGLARVAQLEAELAAERAALASRREAFERGEAPPPPAQSKAKEPKKKMKEASKGGDKRKDGKGLAFRSVTVEGFEILIGKGDAENDQLTFKVADNADFWLHVANLPGSHVVIRNPDKLSEVPRAVLERAAELAAFHSKAKDGGKVEVHLCRIADISKPRGFAPGKVMLKQWKAIRVYPKG